MWIFISALSIALANLPLLWIEPSRRDQRLWRALGVQRLRRWVTRRRNPGLRHLDGSTVRAARTNILWHFVLSVVFAFLTLHPWLARDPIRPVRYLLLLPCAAYLLGSIIQRQKIVIAVNERARASRN
jgi:hypothetical protein